MPSTCVIHAMAAGASRYASSGVSIGPRRESSSLIRRAWHALLRDEVVARVDVLDQRRTGRFPTQLLARQRARCRSIERPDRAEPAEVLDGAFGLDRCKRAVEASPDRLRDRACRHAFLRD